MRRDVRRGTAHPRRAPVYLQQRRQPPLLQFGAARTPFPAGFAKPADTTRRLPALITGVANVADTPLLASIATAWRAYLPVICITGPTSKKTRPDFDVVSPVATTLIPRVAAAVAKLASMPLLV